MKYTLHGEVPLRGPVGTDEIQKRGVRGLVAPAPCGPRVPTFRVVSAAELAEERRRVISAWRWRCYGRG
jgi:hypothetical protein